MLPFSPPSVYQTSKCFATHGKMGHLVPNQVPSKSKPWTTFASQDFIHRADLIIPQEVFEMVREALINAPAPQYKRVVMSLADIIEPDFMGKYIKSGSIAMLSEGRMGVDNVFTLRQGILTMYLDKAAYEQTGIVGKPHGAKGDRGLKPRWVVEIDLNSASMSPGKKGFNRLVYAAKNALGQPLRWLLYHLADSTPTPDPLVKHNPTTFTVNPSISQNLNTSVPDLKIAIDTNMPKARAKEDFEDISTEFYEWLSLVRLQSPRIQPRDQINHYLCRYQVPGDNIQEQKLCKISWHGFLPPWWARQTLVDILTTLPSKTWFSLSTTTFSKGLSGDNAECTILRLPDSGGEYLLWEVKSHE
ncbi:ribonuclease P 40kDa subunit-domain-containing protein [Rhypophila decipiens]|uniref:Ribonuclease P 40kDa subunit-domain-containing protein n=1 Tax=Rhypophila decipiens TaxID=261697 RepID=A0AAN7B6I2_9PEZI|nr:ribonuclease P 40kDa subunit-domain-containing protein [Rhypophila decipiens]